MGVRGPTPTPTELLEARGSRKGQQRGAQPKPAPGRPECPDWLTDDGRAVWDGLVPALDDVGMLSQVDRLALGRYCSLFIDWLKCRAFVDKHGDVHPVKDAAGMFQRFEEFPQAQKLMRLSDVLLRLEREFGLTPSARARLAQPFEKKAPKTGKARFFEPKLVG